jgi:hypothetical protein
MSVRSLTWRVERLSGLRGVAFEGGGEWRVVQDGGRHDGKEAAWPRQEDRPGLTSGRDTGAREESFAGSDGGVFDQQCA